jgi:hypothetical protein
MSIKLNEKSNEQIHQPSSNVIRATRRGVFFVWLALKNTNKLPIFYLIKVPLKLCLLTEGTLPQLQNDCFFYTYSDDLLTLSDESIVFE